MSKGFLAVIAVVILVFAGIFAFNSKQSNSGSKSSSSGTGTPTNHVEGQGKSGITLVEYGDYQCPFCEQYYPVVKQVQQEFNDQIRVQFRNYPLINLHQNAFAAARAAEAAGLQNKFWEMHDALYENQSQWSESGNPTSFFNTYAQQIGLNVNQFKRDYASSKVNDLINADKAAGDKLKVQGTPTFFLDGKQIDVTASASSFEKPIKDAIAKKSAAQKQ